MRKELLLLGLCAGLFSVPGLAWHQLRPVATLSFGADAVNMHLNQNITLTSPFQNSYDSGGHNIQPVAGFFLGAEGAALRSFLAQLGVSYYLNKAFNISGSVYQFTDPTMNNLAYHYQLESQRVLVEGKLLATFRKIFHPFLTLGAGEALNQAYQYTEVPVATADIPLSQGFRNRTYHSFTYQVGLGLDTDINKHFRCGLSYRFVDLGQAGLGSSPLQEGTQTINYNHLRVNEFLVQLSFLG